MSSLWGDWHRLWKPRKKRKKTAWEVAAADAAYCGDGPGLKRALAGLERERKNDA